MFRLKVWTPGRLAACIGSLCAIALPRLASSQVVVTPTVTNVGALFHYNFTITNGTVFDLSLITIDVLASADAVRNLTTPDGFTAFFDPNFGTVDFSEVTNGFAAGSSLSGFQFDSPVAPSDTSFQALGLDPDTGGQVAFSGATLAPAAVPEPGLLPLGVSLAVAWAVVAASRRRSFQRLSRPVPPCRSAGPWQELLDSMAGVPRLRRSSFIRILADLMS